ncbi:unnamed protein product [Schistocephalus solidus]|uniref:Small ribosomal subunit protein mS39 n=1 Tax=Schistocephalus solidus TaxID=70667 RepID=A0A183TAM8_SCHSO|nr:unnamed protein product [Schistocephalus solidus]
MLKSVRRDRLGLLLGFLHRTRLESSQAASVVAEDSGGTVEPPKRRYRDEVSVLRALSSTVEPATGLPDYRCLPEPWLGSSILSRTFLQAKAAGRNAARHVARSFLPNDLTALATELPRIDCLVPLQTAEFIRSQFDEGKISEEEAIDRLILLLHPKGAWSLYLDSKSHKSWKPEVLHRLLDLLCATNSGAGGANFFENLPFVDRGNLPDAEELYFARENRIFSRHLKFAPKNSKVIVSATPESSNSSPSAEDEVGEQKVEKVELDEAHKAEVSGYNETLFWLPNGPAEQLWADLPAELHTASAYCSMIRGAAKFDAADRAWILMEEARRAGHRLPLTVYNALLRCTPRLTAAAEAQDVWPCVQQVLGLIKVDNLVPNGETFSAILFALGRFLRESSIEGDQTTTAAAARKVSRPLDYAAKALGIFRAAKKRGIEPTLGLYANLIRTIMNSHPSNKFGSVSGYRMFDLLSDIIKDLERRWVVNPPSWADILTRDDFDFVHAAMSSAQAENSSLLLLQRLYNLVHHNGDKRFLFSDSIASRDFYTRYCSSFLVHYHPPVTTPEAPVETTRVQAFVDLYRAHRQAMLSNQRVCGMFVQKMKQAIAKWNRELEGLRDEPSGAESLKQTAEKSSDAVLTDLSGASSLAFIELSNMLFDYAAVLTRLPPKLPLPFSEAILAFSVCENLAYVRSPEGSLFSLMSHEATTSAANAAAALLEVIRIHESRLPPQRFPLSSAELTGLVRMALLPVNLNAVPYSQQTVSHRQANERALDTARTLLGVAKKHSIVSDLGALELARTIWQTSGDELSERLWFVLEYMESLKYLSRRCLEHHFVPQFRKILDLAQSSLRQTATFDRDGGGMLSGLSDVEKDAFNRLQLILVLKKRFSPEVDASLSPSTSNPP